VKLTQDGVEEVVMCISPGHRQSSSLLVTEGLSSNVACLYSDGSIVTAGTDYVLAGTIRELFIDIVTSKFQTHVEIKLP
jgi:branched-subunit amino acid aminotransferase/4-amino-4-deoxychorismate lyase